MAVKRGRFGQFLGCVKYPECKGIKKLAKPAAPAAEDGEEGVGVAAQSEV
jgi:ssDNA-binding Zn-finger/Zn-ribbon topoisomerase 1